jgi:hypothetical protein
MSSAAISPSPLLGYNNNVRHRGKVFHIQTEDSGVKYGHIMTHLFADGGRILKSVKTSYAEYIGTERMSDIVREMMKQQHKAMFISLRDGKFDVFVEQVVAPSPALRNVAPEVPARQASPASGEVRPAAVPPPLPPKRTPREEAPELTLDIDSLESAAAAAQVASPVLSESRDLPPPPAQLLREKTATPKPPPLTVTPVSVRRSSSTTVASERRYAPTRPASIFGQARPQQGKSIFGEDVMSDKSLDEVILSYLADDLEGDKK